MTKVALIHTARGNVPVFDRLIDELAPDASVETVVDESLLDDTVAAGRLTEAVTKRLDHHVRTALDNGAELVMVTCSSVGPAVDEIAASSDVPILRIDQPMAAAAVASGTRIGVLATLRSTLEPTVALVRREAAAAGRSVDVVARVAGGAFEALRSGDGARHDELVADAFRQLAPDVEVVVLAQASMARVMDAMPADDVRVPVLASPRLGVSHLARILAIRAGRSAR